MKLLISLPVLALITATFSIWLPQQLQASIIYQSATFSPYTEGTPVAGVLGSQFLGARFQLDSETMVDDIGGYFDTSNYYPGTLFGAIVSLTNSSALPTGNPFDTTTVAETTFSLPTGYTDILVPLSVTLPAGEYGLVFGGGVGGPGAFGATSAAGMPESNVDIPGQASYFFWNQTDWDSGGLSNVEFVVTGTPVSTPEPSSLTLLAAGAIGLVGFVWRRKRKRSSSFAGETVSLKYKDDDPVILPMPSRRITTARRAA